MIHLPDQLLALQSEWKYCTTSSLFGGLWDPPRTLRPGSALVPTTSPISSVVSVLTQVSARPALQPGLVTPSAEPTGLKASFALPASYISEPPAAATDTAQLSVTSGASIESRMTFTVQAVWKDAQSYTRVTLLTITYGLGSSSGLAPAVTAGIFASMAVVAESAALDPRLTAYTITLLPLPSHDPAGEVLIPIVITAHPAQIGPSSLSNSVSMDTIIFSLDPGQIPGLLPKSSEVSSSTGTTPGTSSAPSQQILFESGASAVGFRFCFFKAALLLMLLLEVLDIR